jgi:hypothetical protein
MLMSRTSTRCIAVLAAALSLLLAPGVAHAANCAQTSVGFTPLNDLGTGTYQGQQGGLYPGGANVRPQSHEIDGQLLADSIVPLDGAGNPAPGGRYALISIGMSNTTQEFQAFLPRAASDPLKDSRLVAVDGAQGGVTAALWADPNNSAWATADSRLAAAGLTRNQVTVAWVKLANAGPTTGFPAATRQLQSDTQAVVQNLHNRYPNLKLVYLSSRIYAGYANTTLNPEPYAYEGGFAFKWLIGDQLAGSPALNFDPSKGAVRAPWLSWGPYLWADGLRPRSDGLTWSCSDLQASDGTHPSPSGQQKVASMLLSFFQTDSTARLWYRPPMPSTRTLTLGLKKGKAKGTLSTDGFVGCAIDTRVAIQRRSGRRWKTATHATTSGDGAFQRKLGKSGTYRALVQQASVGAERNQLCLTAHSKRRHRG